MSQDDDFMQQLRATFLVEAREHVQEISSGLLQLESAADPSQAPDEIVESVFRSAHSLKGAARAVELGSVEALCQSLEDVFAAWRAGRSAFHPAILDVLHRGLDAIGHLLASTEDTSSATGGVDIAGLRLELRRMIAAAPPGRFASRDSSPGGESPRPQRLPVGSAAGPRAGVQSGVRAADTLLAPAHPAQMESTVRIAQSKLEAHLLEAEEMLVAKLAVNHRAAELRELAAWLGDWRKRWSSIDADLHQLRQGQPMPAGTLAPLSPQLAHVLDFCEWSRDAVRTIEHRAEAIGQAARRDRAAVSKLVDSLQENAKKLLLLPFGTISASFPRLVRDLCRDQGKQADLVATGEQTELDKRVLEAIKDPLIHLLRNAVDHAVEAPASRSRRGKAPRATIRLAVSQVEGSKVQLLVADDGEGVDLGKVRAALADRGLARSEDVYRMDDDTVRSRIFESQLSTRSEVSALSGRGLGLAIVREKVEKLGGTVSVESVAGSGTTFRIVLPLVRATFRGVLVRVADRLLLAPTDSVTCVARIGIGDIRTAEGRDTISLGGQLLALVRLADVLKLSVPSSAGARQTHVKVFVAGPPDQAVAFAVDAILDEQEVLVKPLRKPLVRVPNIAAAAVLGSGVVVPVLNTTDLVRSARRIAAGGFRSTEPAKPPPPRRSVLVAEDSITSRMLLRAILESAGYAVQTAVDGSDAYLQLRTGMFDLLVSDVEMPRLNGFDLTARIRADRKLSGLPVVLITSRESREDRERGIDVGANAYIAKSSFDQSNLIETLRQLL